MAEKNIPNVGSPVTRRGRLKFMDESVNQEIALAYQEGASSGRIADKYKCSKYTILRTLRRCGVEIRRTENEYDEVEVFYSGPIISQKSAKEFGLPHFFTGKPCMRGHIARRLTANRSCSVCATRIHAATDNQKNGRLRYRTSSIGKAKRSAAKKSIHRREKNNAYERKLRATSLQYRLKQILRGRIYKALRGLNKSGSGVRDIGCSLKEFISYIEIQFHSGMTWDNWGKCWQLDHERPLAEFDLTMRPELLKAIHYTNLRPLLISDHMEKNAQESRQFGGMRRGRNTGEQRWAAP